MWGSDRQHLWNPVVRAFAEIYRVTEAALGDGVKKVYESEKGFDEETARVTGETNF